MAITVDESQMSKIISYMKAEEQAEDPAERLVIEDMCLGAMTYLANVKVVETEKNSPLYWQVVKAMTLHAYDHRDEGIVVPPGVRDTFNQLKLMANYPEEDNK